MRTCEMPRLKSVLGRRPTWAQLSSELGGTERREVLCEGPAIRPQKTSLPSRLGPYEGPPQYARGSLAHALELARHQPEACAASLQEEVDADTSRATIVSLQKTWHRVSLQAGVREPFQLNPTVMFTVTGILKRAQYRSAANYLCAARRAHLEAGHPWGPQHEQAFKQAVRAARRNLGPPKQAEAVPLDVMSAFTDPAPAAPLGPLWPGAACLLASWWFVREIEASHAQISHLRWEASTQTVYWRLPNSKTDPTALGTERAHACCCKATGTAMCPFHRLQGHVRQVQEKFGASAAWVFPTADNKKPTKAGWPSTFVAIAAPGHGAEACQPNLPRFSGHSARASGAQWLAQAGVELWKTQLPGRWTSSTFLRYIRDAPLARLHHIINDTARQQSITLTGLETPEVTAELQPATVETVPAHRYVRNLAPGGKLHRVATASPALHPRHWRARCGWFFSRGYTEFQYEDTATEPKCKTCFTEARHHHHSPPTTSTSTSSRA